MLKLFCLNSILLVTLCGASIIQVPSRRQNLLEPVKDLEKIEGNLTRHLIDFLYLVDIKKVKEVAMQHMNDLDVVNFLWFYESAEFKEVMLRYENIKEFKKGLDYIQNKGYDVKSILDLINSILKLDEHKRDRFIPPEKKGNGNGLNELLGLILEVLPIREWKYLFEEKLETDPEFQGFIDVVLTEEFQDILLRYRGNPELHKVKRIFKDHGLDLEEFLIMFQDIDPSFRRLP